MKKEGIKIGMNPSHAGAFIKIEVLDELGLSVTKAAEVLDVRRATLSELVNEKIFTGDGFTIGKGVSSRYGYVIGNTSMVQRHKNAKTSQEN